MQLNNLHKLHLKSDIVYLVLLRILWLNGWLDWKIWLEDLLTYYILHQGSTADCDLQRRGFFSTNVWDMTYFCVM